VFAHLNVYQKQVCKWHIQLQSAVENYYKARKPMKFSKVNALVGPLNEIFDL